jgi:squalene cyclase
LPRPLRSRSDAARRAAAQWLVRHEFNGGGWGYNDSVGCDADSTAHAILFLSSEPVGVSRASYERLAEFQQSDGGFSTYSPDEGLGSWGVSHPDVTAVAARALLTNYEPGSAVLTRANEYILRRRNEDGTWDSFWWSSPLYATSAVLLLLYATGSHVDLARTHQTLSEMTVENSFNRALLIDSHMQTHACASCNRVEALTDMLVSEQLSDGSWASAPILRLTSRDCTDPAASTHAGPLFADLERLFTSATVLKALSHVAGDEAVRARTDRLTAY